MERHHRGRLPDPTLIANGFDLDHPAIRRVLAMELDPDSDLGELPVTVAVGTLAPAQVADALTAGAARAEGMLAADLLHGAALGLQGEVRVVGPALAGGTLFASPGSLQAASTRWLV